MKILGVNKFFYLRGGCETYYFMLNKLLELKCHQVVHFSMKDKSNFESPYSGYFVDNIDYSNMDWYQKIIYSFKIIYSLEAKNKIQRLINDEGPDIAHIHNFQHQMSPSILHGIKKYKIPIVNTVHDFKSICPNYKMLRSGHICEDCKGGRYYKCFINKCVKNSWGAGFVNMVEAYTHSLLKSYELVDKFICPSRFIQNKMIEFGIPEQKTEYVPNCININEYISSCAHDGYFIYAGRLSHEKGINTLVKAMKHVNRTKLIIIGTGPEEKRLKELAENLGLKNIAFCGFKSGRELKKLIRRSMFMVLPSEWYENCPMAILEAMASGKAVIGSRIGGIPELVDDGKTGLTFKPGDFQELAQKINTLINNPNCAATMGKAARKKAEELFDQETHCQRIISIYKSLV